MGRNIDENENLARAPLALADSFETSLPPCFQRKFVDENGSMWKSSKIQRNTGKLLPTVEFGCSRETSLNLDGKVQRKSD